MMKKRVVAVLAAVGLCGQAPLPAAPPVPEQIIETEAGAIRVETVAAGLEHPWSLAFLPDGRMLVTERPGRLRVAGPEGTLSEPLAGVPRVFAEGQGGLLDIALDPNFAKNKLIYLSFAEPGVLGAATAVVRARLGEASLKGVVTIFRQQPRSLGHNHFGSRLAFGRDGTLFVTLGDRFKFEPAQDLTSHLGKILRLHPDGSVPKDNPFVGQTGVRPEIWSSGHRNVQGAAIHPETGALWTHEFGPAGGDEINIAEAGKNYGWPLVSWGTHYDGRDIPDPPTRPDLEPPLHDWTPSISPSGMMFYTGDAFPAWRGNLFTGGLSSGSIWRLTLEGNHVVHQERLDLAVRIRDVRQGPDGYVYALTDEPDGKILRLVPQSVN